MALDLPGYGGNSLHAKQRVGRMPFVEFWITGRNVRKKGKAISDPLFNEKDSIRTI